MEGINEIQMKVKRENENKPNLEGDFFNIIDTVRL